MTDSISQKLAHMDIKQTLDLLDHLDVEIGTFGGRHYVEKGHENEGYVTLQELMNRLLQLQKAHNKISSLAWRKIEILNSKGNQALNQAGNFARFGTWVRQFFGNLFHSKKEAIIAQQKHNVPNLQKFTQDEIDYFNKQFESIAIDRNPAQKLFDLFKSNDLDLRFLDLEEFKKFPAPILQQFKQLALQERKIREADKEKFNVPAQKWIDHVFTDGELYSPQGTSADNLFEKGKAFQETSDVQNAAKYYIFAIRKGHGDALTAFDKIQDQLTNGPNLLALKDLAKSLNDSLKKPIQVYSQHIEPLVDNILNGAEMDSDLIKFVQRALSEQIDRFPNFETSEVKTMRNKSRELTAFMKEAKRESNHDEAVAVAQRKEVPVTQQPTIMNEELTKRLEIARDQLAILKTIDKSLLAAGMKTFFEGNVQPLVDSAMRNDQVKDFIFDSLTFLLHEDQLHIYDEKFHGQESIKLQNNGRAIFASLLPELDQQ